MSETNGHQPDAAATASAGMAPPVAPEPRGMGRLFPLPVGSVDCPPLFPDYF
jgi:hypothetical protein